MPHNFSPYYKSANFNYRIFIFMTLFFISAIALLWFCLNTHFRICHFCKVLGLINIVISFCAFDKVVTVKSLNHGRFTEHNYRHVGCMLTRDVVKYGGIISARGTFYVYRQYHSMWNKWAGMYPIHIYKLTICISLICTMDSSQRELFQQQVMGETMIA